MNINANIETAESIKERAKAAFGFDLPSALDLVKRSDYDSDEAYLDACTRAEIERSSPEYRAARNRLKADEAYKTIRAAVTLDSIDQRNIDEKAADLARQDLAAGRIAASGLGDAIAKYAEKLGEERKTEKASAQMFNALMRGQL